MSEHRTPLIVLFLLIVTLGVGCQGRGQSTPVETGIPTVPEEQNATPTEEEWHPKISVSQLPAEVGGDVRIEAQGFPPEEDLVVGIGRVNSEYDVIAQGRSNAEGSLKTQVMIPDFVESEYRWVIVVAARGHRIKAVSKELEIEALEPSIEVSSLRAAVGDEVKITGRGFPVETAVQLGVGRVDSEYDLTAEAQTGTDGSLQVQFTIPDFVDPDDQWVIVVTANEGRIETFSEILEITE
ncbi:MAG: hypothetical protein R6U51_01305 [Anaerolineales bacterium]